MKIRLLLAIALVAFGLSGCGKKSDTTTQKPTTGQKVLINELELSKRPFIAFVPHTSNRVFTFFAQNATSAQDAVVDVEYQAGDLLKGTKISITPPISNPYTKAIVLGSCSTGGKCSFDKDLSSGNLKFKLSFAGESVAHILKGDFVFIQGVPNLPDGKVIFEPSKANAKDNLILGNAFGLPKPISDKEVLLYPIYLSATTDKQIAGTLKVRQAGVTEVLLYDGQNYQPIKTSYVGDQLIIPLSTKPYIVETAITRDDEKGAVESTKLDIVGPIVLIK